METRDGFDFKETDEGGELTVHVHVDGRRGWRCPECGRLCPVYDDRCEERLWRGMVKSGLSKSKVSEFLRIDWKTVGRLVELVWRDLEPDPAARFGGLVRIGIDEVSFRKGHRNITTASATPGWRR